MTKFGFIRSGKGEIFWRKTQRNETIGQLSDLERQRQQVNPFCFDVSMNSKDDQCSQSRFLFIKTEHFQSFKKRP